MEETGVSVGKGDGEGEGSHFDRRTSQKFQAKFNIFEQISQSASTETPTTRISFTTVFKIGNNGLDGKVKKLASKHTSVGPRNNLTISSTKSDSVLISSEMNRRTLLANTALLQPIGNEGGGMETQLVKQRGLENRGVKHQFVMGYIVGYMLYHLVSIQPSLSYHHCN